MGIDPTDFDLNRLLALRREIDALSPSAPPAIRLIAAPRLADGARVGLLPGSYNPPTSAHLALAACALSSGTLDVVIFSLATRTVNKERVEGMSLEDRLLLLSRLVARQPELGVSLVNRGLYVEQAEIARNALPGLSRLWFVVGFDKIVQIFDPRYYDDRDQALDRLFQLASFLVAPRGYEGDPELDELLDRPENRRYRSSISRLAVPSMYRDVSSSRVRATADGAIPDVPPLVARFIEAYDVYGHAGLNAPASVDRYAWRQKLVDLAEAGQIPLLPPPELARLWERIVAPDPTGAELRGRVTRGQALIPGDRILGSETR